MFANAYTHTEQNASSVSKCNVNINMSPNVIITVSWDETMLTYTAKRWTKISKKLLLL